MSSSAPDGALPSVRMWAVSGSQGDSPEPPLRLEDEALMARVQGGDEAALGILVDRYARLVLSVGARILRDPGEAQELVQDVFLHVYRKCHLFDPVKGGFRGWLIRITSRRAFDRREYLNLHRFYDNRNLDDFVDVIQAADDVEYQIQLSQNEAGLRKAFESLSEKQRTTLELYFFEGYTLREVSTRMNESLANTRHHYYRGLERLKSSVRQVPGKSDQP